VAYGLHANFNTGQGIMAAYDYDVVSKFFGINSVGDYGLANMMVGGAKSVAEFAGGAIVGIGEGAWGTVKGLGTFAWGLVSNSPIENGRKAWATVQSVGSAVYNYDKTWSAITTSVSQGWTEFVNADAYGKGKTVGHVAEAVAEIFVPASKVANFAKGSEWAAGAINFMDKTDNFYIFSSKAKTLEGFTDVVGHGTATTMEVMHNGSKVQVTHRTMARLLEQQGVKAGDKIRLLSCSTGEISNGFAQGLAHKLGVEVLAPTKILWANEFGQLTVAGAKGTGRSIRINYNDLGKWKSFYSNQKP
jgi:hypothetical protein